MNTLLPLRLENRVLTIRGLRVMIDSDLAHLYGVTTKRLNEQVKRHILRFPPDFMFQLNTIEKAEVIADCDHLGKLKYSKALPNVFSEHGAIQAANVLASTQAIEMGINVVRLLCSCARQSPFMPTPPNGCLSWKRKPKVWKSRTTALHATPATICAKFLMRCVNSPHRRTHPNNLSASSRHRTNLKSPP